MPFALDPGVATSAALGPTTAPVVGTEFAPGVVTGGGQFRPEAHVGTITRPTSTSGSGQPSKWKASAPSLLVGFAVGSALALVASMAMAPRHK
jgi:hypothetical protein